MDKMNDHAFVDAACEQACRSIAPAWPLDSSIAVNPHWARIGMPVRQVAARLAVLGGIGVFPSRAYLQQMWAQGRIEPADLEDALQQLSATQALGLTPEGCVAELATEPEIQQLPLLIDILDNDPNRHTRLSWRQAITHQVSQTCAAYFDEHQADWQPDRSDGLYAFWRDTLQHDHGIGLLMGLPALSRALDALPATRQAAERWAFRRLGLPQGVFADYLEAVLLTVNGWASWCAYLGWQAQLAGGSDGHLRDLLAIRLAWGALLLDCTEDWAADQAFESLQQAWGTAATHFEHAEQSLLIDEVWQLALEAGYQRRLARQLVHGQSTRAHTPHPPAIEVQAAFCIDVRSEPLRRALERVHPGVQTLGFAGFFGLPAAYTPLGTSLRRPQLPGLIAPSMEVVDDLDRSGEADQQTSLRRKAIEARQTRFALADQWRAVSRWPGAAFSYVEAAGVGYLGQLGRLLWPGRRARVRDDLQGLPVRYRAMCRPRVVLSLDDKISVAARVLKAMGLDHQLARLVVLVGHGSQSTNNAHAAGLECGACCGQTGEVNARALAQLLNESAVRVGLLAQGIPVPDSTVFVAALHNTTTAQIEAFDLDLLPAAARPVWNQLHTAFEQAADLVRRERAPRLHLDPAAPADTLLGQLLRRANDAAQTRPEWGLAGNASLIIASRERTCGLDLEGRSFLHDYDAHRDPDGSLLAQLMTAPMLVAHWINWQYHASMCEPTRFGSGNKLLHNVVGGHIGVFEGNGGDLRIGLARQSLHDGERWMHEPVRLTVAIEAPPESIDAVIKAHAVVGQLLHNGWLHLWCLRPSDVLRYEDGQWQPWVTP